MAVTDKQSRKNPILAVGSFLPLTDSLLMGDPSFCPYPNYFFDVQESDLSDFIDLLDNYDEGLRNQGRMANYGVKRSDDRFWDTYDWFQKRFNEDEPVLGGLFDLNRYYYHAR